MTNENAVEVLKELCRFEKTQKYSDIQIREALDIAVEAINTGRVYMTEEDYNLFLEGYKSGLGDYKQMTERLEQLEKEQRPKGEWQTQYETVCGFKYEVNNKSCSNCGHTTKFKFPYCPWCGADMQKEN